MKKKSNDLDDVMESHTKKVAPGQTTTHAISWDDEILGALMGTTYNSHNDPEEDPYSNPVIFTVPLARWIGRLKRRGSESLDQGTADIILSFWYRSPRETLLLSQFPEATWECLVQFAKELEYDDDGREFQVTYEWTRDRTTPFKCNVQNNTIALEGPLLFFPTLQSNHWREKAQVVNRLRGFEVR